MIPLVTTNSSNAPAENVSALPIVPNKNMAPTQIIWMIIVGYDLWLNAEKTLEMLDARFKRD